MEASEKDTQRKKCGAKKRRGRGRCDRWAIPGRDRCRFHGGTVPRGPDSPHWRDGKHAKDDYPTIAEQHAQALADPLLMEYRNDVALYEAMRRSLTIRQDTSKRIPKDIEARILNLGETIRRLKEAEHRRLAQLKDMVPIEQHRRAMMLAANIVVQVLAQRTQVVRETLLAAGVDHELVKLISPAAWQQDMRREMQAAAMRLPVLVIDVGPELTV